MAADVKTTVTELPESRVRVEAEVSPEEIERRAPRHRAPARARHAHPRLPQGQGPAAGGHQPRRARGRARRGDPQLARRPGTSDAIVSSGIEPVGDPKLDLGDLPDEGEPLTFSIEIGVRPPAKLGEYKGLEVGKREAEVSDEDVDREIDALRERLATLETVERPAEEGDFLVIDFIGSVDGEPFEGGEGRDQLLELGSGRLIPGFEEQLVGASAGEERTVSRDVPRRLPRRAPRRRGGRVRGHRQGGQAQAAARARRRLRVRQRLRLPRRAAGRHPREDRAARRSARSRTSSARRPSTRPSRTPRSRSPTSSSPPAPTRCGTRRCTRSSTRASRARPTCASPGAARRRSSRRPSPTPSRRSSARPCSRPSSRPRASSRPTTTCSRRSSRRPSASPPRPRSCSSSSRRPAGCDALRATSPPVRPSTCVAESRQADLRRAGAGAREALDPREGRGGVRGRGRPVDARLKRLTQRSDGRLNRRRILGLRPSGAP